MGISLQNDPWEESTSSDVIEELLPTSPKLREAWDVALGDTDGHNQTTLDLALSVHSGARSRPHEWSVICILPSQGGGQDYSSCGLRELRSRKAEFEGAQRAMNVIVRVMLLKDMVEPLKRPIRLLLPSERHRPDLLQLEPLHGGRGSEPGSSQDCQLLFIIT